jgi:hypothetical protein
MLVAVACERCLLSLNGRLQLGAVVAVEELGALDDNRGHIGGDGATDEHAGSRSRSGGESSHIEEK